MVPDLKTVETIKINHGKILEASPSELQKALDTTGDTNVYLFLSVESMYLLNVFDALDAAVGSSKGQ